MNNSTHRELSAHTWGISASGMGWDGVGWGGMGWAGAGLWVGGGGGPIAAALSRRKHIHVAILDEEVQASTACGAAAHDASHRRVLLPQPLRELVAQWVGGIRDVDAHAWATRGRFDCAVALSVVGRVALDGHRRTLPAGPHSSRPSLQPASPGRPATLWQAGRRASLAELNV